jgi:hypothetical protein
MIKTQVIPGLLIIVMGLIDCVTTVIGVLYSGATELNPFMAGIVNSNIGAFLVVKIAATMLVASAYIVANKTLMSSANKTAKSFKFTSKVLKVGYAGIIIFLCITVINNLIILLA